MPTHTRTVTATASPTATATATPSATRTSTSIFVADANCDGAGSAPDFTAAIIVSGDSTKFPGCADADAFRGHRLTDFDLAAVLHDIFRTFDQPWTPTPTVSPTVTPTSTKTRIPSLTPAITLTATASITPTYTPTFTPTPTNTPTPTRTATITPTRTATPTPTVSPTRTPTGIAYQLSGQWLAQWSGQTCYLDGQPFLHLSATTYEVTAVDGRLDIQIVDGVRLGRGLVLNASGTVQTTYRQPSGNLCFGQDQEFVFDYAFTLRTDGTGSATAHWTYGFNANCAVCEVNDTATLRRVSGPGT